MVKLRNVHQIEFVTVDGVRIEFSKDGWRIQKVRQLGEATRLAALALLERIEDQAQRYLPDPLDPEPMRTLCDRIAARFKLRITHRRIKKLER